MWYLLVSNSNCVYLSSKIFLISLLDITQYFRIFSLIHFVSSPVIILSRKMRLMWSRPPGSFRKFSKSSEEISEQEKVSKDALSLKFDPWSLHMLTPKSELLCMISTNLFICHNAMRGAEFDFCKCSSIHNDFMPYVLFGLLLHKI